MNAAQKCFIKYGLHGARVSHVCHAAGVSSGVLFYHFKNMDEIIEAVVRHTIETVTRRLTDFLTQHKNPLEALMDVSVSASVMRASWGVPPGLRLEIYAESERNIHLKQIIQTGFEALLGVIEDTVARAQRAGQIRPDLPKADCARTISLIWNGISMSLSADANYDINYYEKLMTGFTQTWLTTARRSER